MASSALLAQVLDACRLICWLNLRSKELARVECWGEQSQRRWNPTWVTLIGQGHASGSWQLKSLEDDTRVSALLMLQGWGLF